MIEESRHTRWWYSRKRDHYRRIRKIKGGGRGGIQDSNIVNTRQARLRYTRRQENCLRSQGSRCRVSSGVKGACIISGGGGGACFLAGGEGMHHNRCRENASQQEEGSMHAQQDQGIMHHSRNRESCIIARTGNHASQQEEGSMHHSSQRTYI